MKLKHMARKQNLTFFPLLKNYFWIIHVWKISWVSQQFSLFMERDYEDIFSQFVTLEWDFKFIGAIWVAGLDFLRRWVDWQIFDYDGVINFWREKVEIYLITFLNLYKKRGWIGKSSEKVYVHQFLGKTLKCS